MTADSPSRVFLLRPVISLLAVGFGLWITWQAYRQLPPHEGVGLNGQLFIVCGLLLASVLGTTFASAKPVSKLSARRLGVVLALLGYVGALGFLALLLVGTLGSGLFGAADWPFEYPDSQLDWQGWADYMKFFVRLWFGIWACLLAVDTCFAIVGLRSSRSQVALENPE